MTAITNAKIGALCKTRIESAVARGQGRSCSGAQLESLTVEAMLPFSVAAVIECQTDQKLRVLHDLRGILHRFGGSITPIAFLFDRKGRVVFERENNSAPSTRTSMHDDVVLSTAIDAGATDVDVDSSGRLVIDTEPKNLLALTQSLVRASLGLQVLSSDTIYDPKRETMVTLEHAEMAELERLISLIQEDSSVQDVYLNAA
jgi:transcriptional/translational regulatory protein YebC/TACO1